MDESQIIGLALGLGALAVGLLIWFIKANMVLCQPNELVVIAGGRQKGADGSAVGYRFIRGGRGFKIPLLESVARLPLTGITLEVKINKAMAKGMIPVSVEGRSTVKLAGRSEDGVEAAIERYLGKGTEPVIRTAQQAIEGAIRGMLADLTPEEANAQRLELGKKVASQAREDLRPLGIVLDLFQIRDISDEQGYLEAIGRKRNAKVQSDARIAEARAEAEARQVAAEQKRIGREAEVEADLKIIEIENTLAVKAAELEAHANQASERAKVAGPIARAEEEVSLHAKRVELAERKHQAEIVVPAAAEREAKELRAQGDAARILADGKATAEAIDLMKAQWEDGDTRDLFLIRLLPELTDMVTRTVAENLQVDRLTILDGGNGEGLPNYVRNVANSAVVLMEQVKNATGLDLAKLAEESRTGAGQLPKEID
jgi:flotillin